MNSRATLTRPVAIAVRIAAIVVWGCAALASLPTVHFAGAAEPSRSGWVSSWTSPWNRVQAPQILTAVWTDTVLNQPGREGVRGFGGRLMFYVEEGARPVRVEGRLIVYAFEEDGDQGGDHIPDRRYVFTPQQFAKHYSKSELGHSYSVWLPWETVGGPPLKVTLVARFEPNGGTVVVSELARQILPGIVSGEGERLAESRPAGPGGPGVRRPAGFAQDATGPDGRLLSAELPSQRPRMTTTTIDLALPTQRGPAPPVPRLPTAGPQAGGVAPGLATPPSSDPNWVLPGGMPPGAGAATAPAHWPPAAGAGSAWPAPAQFSAPPSTSAQPVPTTGSPIGGSWSAGPVAPTAYWGATHPGGPRVAGQANPAPSGSAPLTAEQVAAIVRQVMAEQATAAPAATVPPPSVGSRPWTPRARTGPIAVPRSLSERLGPGPAAWPSDPQPSPAPAPPGFPAAARPAAGW